jgi:ATP-binding cassette subfamily B multidrug efflux pump
MRPLRYLNKYIWKYKYRLILGTVFIIVSNIFAIYPPQIIREAFNAVEKHLKGTSAANEEFSFLSAWTANYSLTETLLFFGVLVLVLAMLKGLFTFFMRQTIIVMSRLIEYDLKNEIYAHYQRLDMSFYKANNTGDIMNRISEDVSRVRMYLGPGIMYTINLIVLFVLVITTMLNTNVKLTLYSLIPLPLLSILIYYVSNKINKKSEQMQAQLSDLTTISQESFSGIRILKSFVREQQTEGQFNHTAKSYMKKALAVVKVEATFMPIMLLLIGLSTILTVYIGGKETIAGTISTGHIAEFVIYVNMLTWPVTAIGWVTSLTQRAAASQKRINSFLTTQPTIKNTSSAPFQAKGTIQFREVSFKYPNADNNAISGISFAIEPGKTLAIIGKTGAGKSTIANLICRLFDPDSGQVNINGQNIKSVNIDALRSGIGYVPQEVFLFSDTISNNISFGLPHGEELQEAIHQAAKDAAIYDAIQDFPNGFSTKLGERGITLSGGQKQRLSIARAIIKNPDVLIFDDCLSAVDTETEATILHNLKRIMHKKTAVIISHRISSVQHADEILVLDKGKIVESGQHSSLLKKGGIYSELYRIQSLKKQAVAQ